jgi:hypothetical protein
MKAIKLKGKEINFHFGMEFIDIFCFELGNEFESLDKIGTDSMKELSGVKILRDILYSCAKTYAILNDKPFDFKPLEFTTLIMDKGFQDNTMKDFVDNFLKSLSSNIPTETVKESNSGKKK